MAFVYGTSFEGLERMLDAFVGYRHNGILARLQLLHVDADAAVDDDAELGAAARQMRRVGAGDQRLGRRAAGIHAGAAEKLAFDDGDVLPGGHEAARERGARLPGADD